MMASGIGIWRDTGGTLLLPGYLANLASAYAQLGQVDDAWRCIREAMTAVETTKERWCEAEINRVAGDIALKSRTADAAQAEAYFERALAVARAAGKILGVARSDEHGAALARSGQAG